MFVSRGHERERYGTQSPGPATAAPMDALGRQLVSQRKTQPRWVTRGANTQGRRAHGSRGSQGMLALSQHDAAGVSHRADG